MTIMHYGQGRNRQFPQIVIILVGSLFGFSYGLLCSWTSPFIPALLADNSTNISLEEASYLTVLPPISLALASPIFSLLVDCFGRKYGLLFTSIPHLLAWILTACPTNIWVLYASRLIAGIGDAGFFVATPIYVCEISEPKVRGSWGSIMTVYAGLGIFFSNLIGAYVDMQTTAWICATIPVLHIISLPFLPESPYYLLMKGQESAAARTLMKLRWRSDVEDELGILKCGVERQSAESGSIKDLFTSVSNRKALVTCVVVRIVYMFSGFPAFEVYTQYMFQEAGGSVSQKEAAVIFSGVLSLWGTLSFYLMERFGRRPMMIYTCLGCGFILTGETVYYALSSLTSVSLVNFGWIPLTGMIMYVFVFAPGLGLIPSLLLGEIFSTSVKSKASSVINIVYAAGYVIVPKLFQTLTYNYGLYVPFLMFSIFCFIGSVYSYFCLIETKGKTLEEIQLELKGGSRPM